MARIEDTAGNVTITIPNCDCGMTGGCDKCQPIRIQPYFNRRGEPLYLFPETDEERFMGDNLFNFYRKKGYL